MSFGLFGPALRLLPGQATAVLSREAGRKRFLLWLRLSQTLASRPRGFDPRSSRLQIVKGTSRVYDEAHGDSPHRPIWRGCAAPQDLSPRNIPDYGSGVRLLSAEGPLFPFVHVLFPFCFFPYSHVSTLLSSLVESFTHRSIALRVPLSPWAQAIGSIRPCTRHNISYCRWPSWQMSRAKFPRSAVSERIWPSPQVLRSSASLLARVSGNRVQGLGF